MTDKMRAQACGFIYLGRSPGKSFDVRDTVQNNPGREDLAVSQAFQCSKATLENGP